MAPILYMRMKFPIGIQTFEKIREDDFVYVDKTELVYDLVSTCNVVFLGRPRRFGKSLLLSTIKAYFQGKKELFKGLAMERLEQEWNVHPVIHFSFGSGNYTKPGELENVLHGLLSREEAMYGVTERLESLGLRLSELIKAAYDKTGQKVVVLIDEYDKPLLDVMDEQLWLEVGGRKITFEENNRNILRGVYSVFKDADEYLRFVMLTGVTKFSQISVFSGFNQPKDITMDFRYEGICGITAEEMEAYFAEPIAELAARERVSVEEEKQLLRRQYDGYHFGEEMLDVYNPFSLLNCFDQLSRRDYWFRTGTPIYLKKLLERTDTCFNELAGKWYDSSEFVDYRADVQRPLPMIYQSGYLTIKQYNREDGEYLLDFPNEEVRKGFVNMLSTGYFAQNDVEHRTWIDRVRRALRTGDLDTFHLELKSLLASVSYRFHDKKDERQNERHFQYTFYLIMQMLGTYTVLVEKETSQGRMDCVIETPGYVYIFEFKRNGSAEAALQQIEEKGYANEYAADPRPLYKIGVNFSTQTGTVEGFLVCPPAL